MFWKRLLKALKGYSKTTQILMTLDTEIIYAKLMVSRYESEYESEPGNIEKSIQYDYWKGRRDSLMELRDKVTSIA